MEMRVENEPIYKQSDICGLNVTKRVRDNKHNADINFDEGNSAYREALDCRLKNNDFAKNQKLKVAARAYVDSIEKNTKVFIERSGTEKVENTHRFEDFKDYSEYNLIISDSDISFLDKFSNDKNHSTHSELEYGDKQPTLADVERIKLIAEKAKKTSDDVLEPVKFTRSFIQSEDNSISMYNGIDYYIEPKSSAGCN